MKAVVLHKKLDIRYEDVPDATINDPKEVIVKMLTGGICGSDQHYYEFGANGSAIVVREPLVIGHEGCGIVEEVGSGVTKVKKGDLVVLRPARPCFDCFYCNRHEYTYCENMRHLGSAATMPHVAGCFSDYCTVHEEQCGVVKNLAPEVGAFAEPLAVAYNGVHKSGDIMGKKVLVMGAGPIGCLAVAAAKAAGADRVAAADLRDDVLNIAKQMGADYICNSKTNPEQIEKWCEHKGYFDILIECTGNGFACVQGMKMVKPEGVVSQVGMYGTGHQPTDFGPFSVKGLKWNSVFRFYDEFAPAVNALESGTINPLPLLSASFKPEQCKEAMEAAISPTTSKVQIHFY